MATRIQGEDKDGTMENLKELYEEHKILYLAYENRKRSNEAKFHLDRVEQIIEKIIEIYRAMGGDIEDIIDLNERVIFLFRSLGNWYLEMENLHLSENNLNVSYEYILELSRLEEEAKKEGKKKDKILENKDNQEFEGDVLQSLGILYRIVENFEKAEEFYLKSLKIRQNLFGENHSSVAESFRQLGDLYRSMGNVKKTEENMQKTIEFYLKLLKIRQNLFGDDHPSLAKLFDILGDLYREMGMLEIAEEFYEKSGSGHHTVLAYYKRVKKQQEGHEAWLSDNERWGWLINIVSSKQQK